MKRHVSIHAVKCYGALFDILKDNFDFNLSSNVALHSYGGSQVIRVSYF
jgi:Tat protein secretion system quality control protein TatD with DNase activity